MIAAALAILLLAAPADAASTDQLPGSLERDLIPVYQTALTALGAPDSKDLVAQGYEGVRAMAFDAHYNTQPLVTVLAKPGATPRIEAATIVYGTAAPRRMSGFLEPWDWRSAQLLMEETRRAPRRQAEAKPTPEELAKTARGETWFIVCADSWSVVVEVFDKRGSTLRVRQDSCSEDVVSGGASSLVPMAVRVIEGCEDIRLENGKGGNRTLVACSALQGPEPSDDAQLLNTFHNALFYAPDDQRLASFKAVLAADVRLDWPAMPGLHGADAVTDFWLSPASAFKDKAAYPDSVIVTNDTAEVRGFVSYEKSEDFGTRARFVQRWRRDDAGWVLTDWRVEAFKDFGFGE